jgi:hypothetical protein
VSDLVHAPPPIVIEFCGESVSVDQLPFTIGRDADLVVDEHNRFLHRRFVSLDRSGNVWTLSNVGSQLAVTASDPGGRLTAVLAPGALLPLVFDTTMVRFTAGPTTYEFSVRLGDAASLVVPAAPADDGDATAGRIAMTPDQLRLILVLAEPILNGGGRAVTAMPSSSEAAIRLGWTITKFNRKLDNVCNKLTMVGVRGLHGAPGRLASSRRVRLVEYALATRLVTRDDLTLLTEAVGG